MAASLIGAAVAAGTAAYTSSQAKKQAKNAQNAAYQGNQEYQAAVDRGINESQGYYDQGQNYLAGYRRSGEKATGLLEDILGFNGTDAQNNALAMYRSSPSSQLLGDVRGEAVRRTMGNAAASGLSNAGSTTESLARRLSDIELNNYYNYEGVAKGLSGQGLQAAGMSAQLAGSRGNAILGARSGQGSAAANSLMAGANAGNAAIGASTNAWSNFAGKASNIDWSKYFNSGSGSSGSGSGNNWRTIVYGA